MQGKNWLLNKSEKISQKRKLSAAWLINTPNNRKQTIFLTFSKLIKFKVSIDEANRIFIKTQMLFIGLFKCCKILEKKIIQT